MPVLLEQEGNAQYGNLIRTLVPVSDLTPQLQNKLISLVSIYSYKKKEFVFKEGDMDEYAFYLLDGQIELLSDNQVQSTIVSGTDSARYAMARLQPRQFSARAKTDIVILEMERATLDRLMVMDQQGKEQNTGDSSVEMEVSHISEEDSGDWMTKMLQSELFSRLPTANIQKLFALLEPLEFKAGDIVINQGEAGDYYFIIQEGRCEVIRSPVSGATSIKIAELQTGDSFGEEALLTNATRNASIRMLTDGVLMRLSKDNFINLIKKPTLAELSYMDAVKLVDANKASWLDVRFQNEYEESRIEGSLHIPLSILRTQIDKLQKDKHYIVCCDTGGRSSAATFILANHGFHASYLKGGLSSVPQDALDNKSAQKPDPEKSVTAKTPVPPVQSPEADINHSDLEPGVRASVLEASLAVTNMVLEESKKKQTRPSSDAQKETKKRLQMEKKRLETEKKAAEREAQKAREQEEAKLRKLKEDSEKRMVEEKNKLEDVYVRNTKEMENLQRMKDEAEEQIRKEREKLERETAEAQRKLEEARKKLELEAAKKRAEQETQEKALQSRAKASLEENRRTLANEVAKINEELDRAKKNIAQSDAARKAAEEEAQKIIAEHKQRFERELDKERARLKEERQKLEAEAKKIQETFKEIEKSRKEAEAAREAVQKETQALLAQQKNGGPEQDQQQQKVVDAQIKELESKMQQAQQSLENAQMAENKAKVAVVVNAQELQKRKQDEELIRQQIENDLNDFESTHKEDERTQVQIMAQSDHIKRIRERADAARKNLEDSNKNLLDDIASQLGDQK